MPALRLAPAREHGIVLFVALLVMVALSIAGVALLRSTDAATAVTGNLVLKQAASLAVDRGIERAIHALWEDTPGLDRTQHAPAQNFFACIRGTAGGCMPANNVVPKIPDLLLGANGCSGAGLTSGLIANDDAGNRSCYRDRADVPRSRARDPQQLQSGHRVTGRRPRNAALRRIDPARRRLSTASRSGSKVRATR